MIKSISIVIPVYNEEKFIFQTLKKVASANTLKLFKKIIVIDDGSKDNTLKEIKRFQKNHKKIDLTVLQNKINLGKGATVKKGFLQADGDLVMIQDADLEYNPDDYPTLLKPFFENNADVVYGSRFVTDKPHRVLYYWHFLANKSLTTLSNIFTNLNLTDMETGYKVFKLEVIQKIAKELQSTRFGIEPEITARTANLKNIRIYEVGISYTGRSYGEGKKIGFKDGLKAIFEIIKFNLWLKTPNRLKNIINLVYSSLKESLFEIKSQLLDLPKDKNSRIIFATIFLVGILLRTTGLTWGINTYGLKHVSPYHDETHTYNIAFDPQFFDKFGEYEISKPVYFYRLTGQLVLNVIDRIPQVDKDYGPFSIFLLLRGITSFFGIFSIYIVYLVSKKIFDEKTSLFTTAVYSLLPGQWFMSQLIKGEALINFFMPLTLLLMYMAHKRNKLIWFVFLGIIFGLGLTIKASFFAIIPSVFLFALICIYTNRNNFKNLIKIIVITLVTVLTMIRIFYPYIFIARERFVNVLQDPQNAFQRFSADRYKINFENISNIWQMYQSKEFPFFTLNFSDLATYIHLAGGLIFLIITIHRLVKKKNSFLHISIILTYLFFFLSLNQYGGINEDRYIVPLAPFVAIFSGAMIYLLNNISNRGKVFVNLIIFTILGYMTLFSFSYYNSYVLNEPRNNTAKWLNQNTLPDESVFVFIPSARDKIYPLKIKSLIYYYNNLKEVESEKIKPDYIVLYKTINHNGRWGSLNFLGETKEYPYGKKLPEIIKNNYYYVTSIGISPTVLGREMPDTYITPTYLIYKRK